MAFWKILCLWNTYPCWGSNSRNHVDNTVLQTIMRKLGSGEDSRIGETSIFSMIIQVRFLYTRVLPLSCIARTAGGKQFATIEYIEPATNAATALHMISTSTGAFNDLNSVQSPSASSEKSISYATYTKSQDQIHGQNLNANQTLRNTALHGVACVHNLESCA